MTAMAEHSFNIAPRADADLFQALRAVANDDFLLRCSLDEDGAIDSREIFTRVFPFFRGYGSHVGNLFAGYFENLLAHNLGSQHPQRLISEFISRKEWFAFREVLDDFIEQRFDLIAFQRR